MTFSNQTRIRIIAFMMSIGIVILGLGAYYYRWIPFLDFIELKTIDIRFLSRGPQPAGDQVALAVIDEKSLRKEGKWPWPRGKIADLIQKLSDADARVVALDIGFFEPDRRDALMAIEEIRQHASQYGLFSDAFTAFLDAMAEQKDEDSKLAHTLQRAQCKVVLGYYFNQDIPAPPLTQKNIYATQKKNIRKSKYVFDRYIPAHASRTIPDVTPFQESGFPESNIPLISNSTRYAGYFNAKPDIDGNIRWIPGVMEWNDRRYAPLSLMATAAYFDAQPSLTWTDYGVIEINLGRRPIPTAQDGKIMINFRGGQGSFPYYSVTDILNDTVPATRFTDKIVIVGASAVGLQDIKMTPFDRMPGPEIHANLIDNILSNDFLYYPSGYELLSCLAIVCCGLLLCTVLVFSGGALGLGAFLTLSVGYWFIARGLFIHMGLILNLVYPLFTLSCIYIAVTCYQYLAVEGKRRFIQNAFSTYLAPSVVNELIKSPEKLNLGGEQIEITAFFSDIKGFSTISESLSPNELVLLLNEYLTEMEKIIQAHFGIVDKYEGDAIIAIFGAPYKSVDHGENACLAAMDMQEKLARLRQKWQSEHRPQLHMRIGLSTGLAIVGNMGSKQRMDYTMMGDTVNTAARLEGVNKAYGTECLISDATYASAKRRILAREIDAVTVVGKKQPVTIYQLMGKTGMDNAQAMEIIRRYSRGLAAYRELDWDNAIACFGEVLAAAPEDGPSRIMIERCKDYKKTPPPQDWNRAFSMVSK